MFDQDTISHFNTLPTPFYYYDSGLLETVLKIVRREAEKYGYVIHYALKANASEEIVSKVASYGFGADCVSGNEIKRALDCGIDPDKIAFAGVGKSDEEIRLGLKNRIFTFNVESAAELSVIDKIAKETGTKAGVALRINPNVDAFTHRHITTGIEDSKFGINMWDIDPVLDIINSSSSISLRGLHFHIGSQVQRMGPFRALCHRINELQQWFNSRNIYPGHINVGGGLGIDYENPESIPDFRSYFSVFNELLELRRDQKVHFELGRSITGQAGSLITRVLYVKKGIQSDFVIVDAGMTDLIRPALYQAYHKIENISSAAAEKARYSIVGPICESTDSFGKFIELPLTSRNDLIAIRSAGAYGRSMASGYNLRDLPAEIYSAWQ